MQMQDPAADPATHAPDHQPDAAGTPPPHADAARRDEPWASGQRKRYLASLPETPEAA
jgi:hypothetical protein